MKKTFIYLSLVVVALATVSCGGSKEVTTSQEQVIVVPCSGLEFTTSAEYFRANAVGVSNSLEIASQKAMTTARAKLSASIETTVKTVTDNYLSSYEENASEEARGRFQSLTREVVNQKLTGVRVICQQTTKTTDGKFNSYVAIELAGDELVKGIQSSVENDSKLRTDYEYQKFEKIFDEEMQKLAK